MERWRKPGRMGTEQVRADQWRRWSGWGCGPRVLWVVCYCQGLNHESKLWIAEVWLPPPPVPSLKTEVGPGPGAQWSEERKGQKERMTGPTGSLGENTPSGMPLPSLGAVSFLQLLTHSRSRPISSLFNTREHMHIVKCFHLWCSVWWFLHVDTARPHLPNYVLHF